MPFLANWNFYCLLSFIIGVFAGFDDLRKRYGEVAVEASGTRLGATYLFIRGLAPAVVFLVLYYSHRIEGSAWQAILFGLGWEFIFRAGIYTGNERGKQFWGPYELLVRLQAFMLSRNDGPVSVLRKQYVDKYLPIELNCLALCERILTNVGAWPIPQTRKTLEKALIEQMKEIPTTLDVTCRHKVAYLVLDEVGKRGFQTLLSIPDIEL